VAELRREKEGKQFFLKKEPKTFTSLSRTFPQRA
jgi:hypothetical protein